MSLKVQDFPPSPASPVINYEPATPRELRASLSPSSRMRELAGGAIKRMADAQRPRGWNVETRLSFSHSARSSAEICSGSCTFTTT